MTEQQPFELVQQFYAAIANYDYAALRATASKDFQLLETDQIWNMDTLVKTVAQGQGKVQRLNFFSPIDIKTSQSMCSISYWNKASFSFADKQKQQVWLESAVLIKHDHQWRIQLMHSSMADSQNLPDSVVFEQYLL